MSDIVERLRDDRLMNPDYPTRLEAAKEIERLREEIDIIPPNVRRIWREVRSVRECGGSL